MHMKLLLDFFPLAVFFGVYKFGGGLMPATAALIGCTLISLVITYIKERKLALNPLISGVVIAIFGGLTLYLNDAIFIKMKPTLVNLVFATILLGGLALKKSPLKPLLDSALTLDNAGWQKLTLRWGIFFIFLAVLNEMIWRNYSEAFWVNFKVFGMMPLTLIFMLCQYPLIMRHQKTDSKN